MGTRGSSAGPSVEVEPGKVGFDGKRLARIDAHFQQYIDDGRLPGWDIVISRQGKVVHRATAGWRDREADLPVEADTIFRIYSMSKPITSIAALMLYEEGAFDLKDPVSRFIPSFADVRVFRSGTHLNPVLEPAMEPVRIWHLLTHTAGLTYGFHNATPVDAMYRAAGFELGTPPGADLAACCDVWAGLPLLHQPGAEWNYSVATDVLGRVVEVASGMPLDEFFAERIFEPLGMVDTGFFVPDADHDRLAQLYIPDPAVTPSTEAPAVPIDILGQQAKKPPSMLGGGGGLVSTTGDYHRFCRMLLGGGELDGARLLGTRTLAFAGRNHLPGGADLESIGRPLFSETSYDGIGFGLGFSVVLDAAKNKVLSSEGELAWGGAASTGFWIDRREDLSVIFMTQLLPSSTHPIRTQLRQLVYSALVDPLPPS